MDPTQITPQQAIIYGALVSAALGFVVGLVPLVLGFVKGNKKFGFLGLIASVIGGAILGLLLAIPAAAIFSFLIIRGARPTNAGS